LFAHEYLLARIGALGRGGLVATPEEVEAALRAISQLADEHGRALDKAFRILGDGALTGPGAVRLQQGMTARHGDVREALEGAFEEVRRLAARNPKGPPKVPPPRMGRAPAGARPSQGDKAGGDPELLKLLQAEMNRAGRSWEAAGQQLGGLLSRLGLSQSPGRAVGQAGNWVVGQRRDVQRRREELLKSDQVSPAFAVGLFAFNMTRTLAALQADPKLTAQLRRAGVDPTKIPAAEDPKQAATWWKSLNDEQRRLYIKTFPAVIGWLDGLPAVARDAANRLTLANRIKQLQATPANERTTFETRDLGGLMNLDVRLKDLKAQGKDVYLLGLDSTTPGPWDGFDSGKNPFPPLFPGYDKLGRAIADTKSGPDGRVIVAIGNPDTADHTGVFVPGTTTELDNFEKELKRGESLWNATNEQVDHHVARI
jgi:cell division protein ZapA (FtsZ GTPase activity inhibitor)